MKICLNNEAGLYISDRERSEGWIGKEEVRERYRSEEGRRGHFKLDIAKKRDIESIRKAAAEAMLQPDLCF